MTYYGPKELAAAFRTVRHNTIQIAEEIPEEHYGYRAAPESRSVAETLAHMAVTTRFPEQVHIVEHRSTMEGFDFVSLLSKLAAEEKTPRSKSEILDLLRSEGERFAQALEGLPEDRLGESVSFPAGMVPPTKSRFEMLLGPKEHEMHHRAQLMVLERMLGITPHLTRQMQQRMAAMKAAQAGG
ncbi:MAG: DinB family protein [Bryobacteraceae bacterium]